MKTIPLSQGYEAKVSDKDFNHLIASSPWYVLFNPRTRTPYACRAGGDGEPRTVYMHRQIMNAGDGEQVDHINGNGLDNRRSNLRTCSQSENMRNQAPRTNARSRFKGVTRRSARHPISPWRARITVEGRVVHLGDFKTEEDAARAYNDAAKRLHGDFARLNAI